MSSIPKVIFIFSCYSAEFCVVTYNLVCVSNFIIQVLYDSLCLALKKGENL